MPDTKVPVGDAFYGLAHYTCAVCGREGEPPSRTQRNLVIHVLNPDDGDKVQAMLATHGLTAEVVHDTPSGRPRCRIMMGSCGKHELTLMSLWRRIDEVGYVSEELIAEVLQVVAVQTEARLEAQNDHTRCPDCGSGRVGQNAFAKNPTDPQNYCYGCGATF